MSTTATQEQALAEFRDASAAVRRAFSAHSEAREAQILANRRAAETSDTLLAAQDRLDRADSVLQEAKAVQPPPADIDAAKGLTGNSVGYDTGWRGENGPLNPPAPNGAAGVTHVADPAETGIG